MDESNILSFCTYSLDLVGFATVVLMTAFSQSHHVHSSDAEKDEHPAHLARARGPAMAKLTLSEAARACNVARTTIQRAVKTGRLALDAEHRVYTAELLRIGYQLDAAVLHAASQQPPVAMQQDAAAADAGAADAARDAAPV
jgi:DNA-binding phage protein